MDETGRLLEYHAAGEAKKQQYMESVRAFIDVQRAGDPNATRAAFDRMHAAAVVYYNVFENAAGYTQSVNTSLEWRRKLAEDCCVVLGSRLKHQQLLDDIEAHHGFDIGRLHPGKRGYSSMQRLVREHYPDEAAELREQFVAAKLPVAGFDDSPEYPRSLDHATHATDGLRGKIDFAIITIKEEEFEAVLTQFPPEPDRTVSLARAYVLREVIQNDGSAATVAITRCPTQGNGISQEVFHDIAKDLDPQWVLCVGIAGGAPISEFSLGDVLLGSNVLDMSVEAIKSGEEPTYAAEGHAAHLEVENYCTVVKGQNLALGDWALLWDAPFKPDRKRVTEPKIVLKAKNFYGDEAWRKRTRKSLEAEVKSRPRAPRVSAGLIAASDRLVKDNRVLARWLKIARQIRAVEMESAGVYRAACGRGEHRKGYPAMTIRGISDIVGFDRDDAWTLYACISAAAFAYAFVRSGHVKPRARGIETTSRSAPAARKSPKSLPW